VGQLKARLDFWEDNPQVRLMTALGGIEAFSSLFERYRSVENQDGNRGGEEQEAGSVCGYKKPRKEIEPSEPEYRAIGRRSGGDGSFRRARSFFS